MNKISKKIVALVTMAAFVLTLVPAAAFAAAGDGDVQTSYYKTVDANQSVEVDTSVATEFLINDDATNPATNALQNVYVWATLEGSTTPSSAASFYADEACTTQKLGASDLANVFKMKDSSGLNELNAANEQKVYVKFSRPGTYVLHAGVNATVTSDSKVSDFTELLAYPAEGDNQYSSIEVTAADVAVKTFALDSAKTTALGKSITVTKDGANGTSDNLVNGADITVAEYTDDFLANGIDEDSITFTLKDEAGNVIRNKDVQVSANKTGINTAATVTSDNQGKVKVTYSMDKASDYKLYVSVDSVKITINVSKKTADTKITGIENTTEDAKTLLASSDSKYGTAYGATNFEDAVQFTITNENGEAVNDITGQKIATATADTKYITVDSKPAKSALKADDLQVVWSDKKQAFTLELGSSAKANKAKLLVPGEYTVTVALNNGKTATATFTLANFGTVQSLGFDSYLYTGTLNSDAVRGAEVTDKVAFDDQIVGQVLYVDENGIEVPADASSIGITGSAVEKNSFKTTDVVLKTPSATYDYAFTVDNAEKLAGTEITLTAVDKAKGKMASTTFTVVESRDTNYSLTFDSEKGAANKENTVKFNIVDADGNAVKVSGNVYAYVDNKSNADANVEVAPASDSITTASQGSLKIFSDKETTLDIVVAVKDTDTNAIYANTLKYTVGEQDIAPDTSIVMTIGSNDLIVNNDVVTVKDAAPYVANDRTYVPFRALGEALGAEVVWDNDARTVTYTLGKTEVVMTIGEKTYTVNGEEKTMDVAPEITGDRTYVPVRFVGEALGFKVTALSAADGTTASVVFQK